MKSVKTKVLTCHSKGFNSEEFFNCLLITCLESRQVMKSLGYIYFEPILIYTLLKDRQGGNHGTI